MVGRPLSRLFHSLKIRFFMLLHDKNTRGFFSDRRSADIESSQNSKIENLVNLRR